VASALVGGGSIDDAGVLGAGGADALLGRWVPAPSTLGTSLRSFSWADAGRSATPRCRGLHQLLVPGLGQVLGMRQRGGNAHSARDISPKGTQTQNTGWR